MIQFTALHHFNSPFKTEPFVLKERSFPIFRIKRKNEKYLFKGIVVNEKKAGFLSFHCEKESLILDSFCLNPSFRGFGHFHSIFIKILTIAKWRSCSAIYISNKDLNLFTQWNLERFGFEYHIETNSYILKNKY